MSRAFNEMFLGAGEHSSARYNELMRRVRQGVVLLGGMQQRPTDDPQYVAALSEVENVVRDVAAALLGREIILGRTLPYGNERNMEEDGGC